MKKWRCKSCGSDELIFEFKGHIPVTADEEGEFCVSLFDYEKGIDKEWFTCTKCGQKTCDLEDLAEKEDKDV